MSKNLFNSVKYMKPGRNLFDLTHDFKFTANMGTLVPVMWLPCVPGDHMSVGHETLIRFAPMRTPVMHRMDVTFHTFFVPYRLLWDGWEDFITDTDSGSGVPAMPTLKFAPGDVVVNDLSNLLGIPVAAGSTTDETVCAFPWAAYQFIYNEYYRDQNLIPEVNWQLVDGLQPTNPDLFIMRNRAWMHDYFTSALPFAQKGSGVNIPLGDVQYNGNTSSGAQPVIRDFASGAPLTAGGTLEASAITGIFHAAAPAARDAVYDPGGTLSVAATQINSLRAAFRLQEWKEKNARGGTRYTENIYAHFGVKSSDARLQRPEYITGSKAPVIISEVVQTSATDGTSPQGNMAGHGLAINHKNHDGRYFCEEHGMIMTIMSVMPLPAYGQGINRHLLKISDFSEHYWPEFANLGEQVIYNRELYGFDPQGGDTFGYTPRYAEYRYMPNRVAGDFETSLDFWTMVRQFGSLPLLNGDFVTSDPTTRIFAVTDPTVMHLYCTVLNTVKAVRPMPKFSTPTL